MTSRTIAQPTVQLGQEIDALLAVEARYNRIVFVSAFVSLLTILRLRERLLERFQAGCQLRLTVGVDLDGTSRNVLEELLRWNCEVFIFHNPIVRATFHPKIYLFESAAATTLFVGSNNLTDGGFYTNYEAAVRYDFELPADAEPYRLIAEPLRPFIEPAGGTVQRLTAELIITMAARGLLLTEDQARERRRNQAERQQQPAPNQIPVNPFVAEAVPLPPLPPQRIRDEVPNPAQIPRIIPPAQQALGNRPIGGLLVWQKRLPSTDALQVAEGSHHVGGVRLTQARFENPRGQRINQTVYFRNLFGEFPWAVEQGRPGQEHAFVPMRIFIRERDYGVRNFEISHKPTGEAGQANYTTILRWGREFTPIILRERITNTLLSLYETPNAEAPFLIEIV